MARPDRPVVAVLGDGSSLYAIQALWSAAHYGVGVLVVVLANGRYAIMDALAENRAAAATDPSDVATGVTAMTAAPWPGFGEVSIAGLAAAFGCPAQTVTTQAELVTALDAVLPALADRSTPLVLEVVVP
jgi:benzoylformate decarboxylase